RPRRYLERVDVQERVDSRRLLRERSRAAGVGRLVWATWSRRYSRPAAAAAHGRGRGAGDGAGGARDVAPLRTPGRSLRLETDAQSDGLHFSDAPAGGAKPRRGASVETGAVAVLQPPAH